MLRKHRNRAVHKINGSGSFHRLLVYRAVRLHIVRHVGYMHANLPVARLELADRQRVIEVLGVLRVDGECRHVAHVAALGELLGRQVVRNLVGGLFQRLRVRVRQSVLGKYGVHLGVVVAHIAEHINDFAYRAAVAHAPLHYLHNGFLSVLAAVQIVHRNENIAGKNLVVNTQERIVSPHLQHTDERVLRTLQYLHHLAFGLAALRTGVEEHTHTVLVQCVAQTALGYEYRATAVVRHEVCLSV